MTRRILSCDQEGRHQNEKIAGGQVAPETVLSTRLVVRASA